MKQLTRTLFAAVLTTASCLVAAAQHDICYEGESLQSLPTAVWGCREDAGGTCTITRLFHAAATLGPPAGSSPGFFDVVQLPSAGTFSARIDFTSAAGVTSSRICSVNAVSPFGMRGAASRGAELTGFTSDISGLVSTGVWKLLSPAPAAAYNRVTVEVPADFVAVGGGAVGQEWPQGALVMESYQSDTMGGSGVGNWRRWTAKTADLTNPDPHRTTAYAIGMRITGLHARDLAPLLKVVPQGAYPAMAAMPTNQAVIPIPNKAYAYTGFVPLSGGVLAQADSSNSPYLLGQYVTVTVPTFEACPVGQTCKMPAITGWRVESTDHWLDHPGTVQTAILGLPATVVVGGITYNLVSRYVSATSAVAAHPAVDVGGLRGYALTGIGAAVDWRDPMRSPKAQPPGNLIWKLEPRADLLGASVASKDHLFSSPGSITGYALGIKLVVK